jgi:hypothetical protein
MGAGPGFLQKFRVLPDLFGFGHLERGNDTAAIKGDGVKSRTVRLDSAPVGAFFHVAHELQRLDAVQIENRTGLTVVADSGEIAAHNQEVVEIFPVVEKKMAFYLAAVLVLEGEVQQGFDAGFPDFRSNGDGRQGRMSTGVVGDGQRLYPAVLASLGREFK